MRKWHDNNVVYFWSTSDTAIIEKAIVYVNQSKLTHNYNKILEKVKKFISKSIQIRMSLVNAFII